MQYNAILTTKRDSRRTIRISVVMGWVEDNTPVMAMVGLQFTYAGISITSRNALLHGMRPPVFVVYRQAIATLSITPFAFLTRRKAAADQLVWTWRSFALIFMASLIGVTINQNVYFQGLYLASASMATAMTNILPAITFLLATAVGLERVKFGSLRSLAKIVGTVICVIGAVSMALLKGPKILNSDHIPQSLLIGYGYIHDRWLLGCLYLLGNNILWSTWLILQIPLTACHPDLISLTAWMCFLGALQSALLACFLEPNIEAWRINSYIELSACLFAGIIGSAFSFFVQAWCISKRGPLFSAMFNPLGTVIVAIFATIFLHEEVFLGSSIGAIGVITGLYIVLWGKAEDTNQPKLEEFDHSNPKTNQSIVEVGTDGSSNIIHLEKPLLSEHLV